MRRAGRACGQTAPATQCATYPPHQVATSATSPILVPVKRDIRRFEPLRALLHPEDEMQSVRSTTCVPSSSPTSAQSREGGSAGPASIRMIRGWQDSRKGVRTSRSARGWTAICAGANGGPSAVNRRSGRPRLAPAARSRCGVCFSAQGL